MKKSRFTDSQIMDALKRVEAGLSVSQLCRELGIIDMALKFIDSFPANMRLRARIIAPILRATSITFFSIELGLVLLGRLSFAGDAQQILLNRDIQRFGINPGAEQININRFLGDAHIDGWE